MKNLIAFLFLITLSFNPIFAQKNYTIEFDSTFNFNSNIKSINNYKELNFVDNKTPMSNYYSPLTIDNSKYSNYKNIPSGKEFFNIYNNSGRFDNMPVINPKGNYAMNIIIPDTSIQYSMMIKKP